MDEVRTRLLEELAAFGRANDAAAPDKVDRMLNCGPEAGTLLWILARSGGCRRVLEVGTSNGYATIWLADAVERVVTIELDVKKRELATANFARAGLSQRIALVGGDAGEVLRGGIGIFDMVFLDCDRARYTAWWPDLRRAVAPGGLLAVDNVCSHQGECAPLLAQIGADPAFARRVIVPVDNGVLLAYRERPPAGAAGVKGGEPACA